MLPHVVWWNRNLHITVLFHLLHLSVVRTSEEWKEFWRNVLQSQIGLDRMRVDYFHNLLTGIPCSNGIAFNFDNGSGRIFFFKFRGGSVSFPNRNFGTRSLADFVHLFAPFTNDVHPSGAGNFYLHLLSRGKFFRNP